MNDLSFSEFRSTPIDILYDRNFATIKGATQGRSGRITDRMMPTSYQYPSHSYMREHSETRYITSPRSYYSGPSHYSSPHSTPREYERMETRTTSSPRGRSVRVNSRPYTRSISPRSHYEREESTTVTTTGRDGRTHTETYGPYRTYGESPIRSRTCTSPLRSLSAPRAHTGPGYHYEYEREETKTVTTTGSNGRTHTETYGPYKMSSQSPGSPRSILKSTPGLSYSNVQCQSTPGLSYSNVQCRSTPGLSYSNVQCPQAYGSPECSYEYWTRSPGGRLYTGFPKTETEEVIETTATETPRSYEPAPVKAAVAPVPPPNRIPYLEHTHERSWSETGPDGITKTYREGPFRFVGTTPFNPVPVDISNSISALPSNSAIREITFPKFISPFEIHASQRNYDASHSQRNYDATHSQRNYDAPHSQRNYDAPHSQRNYDAPHSNHMYRTERTEERSESYTDRNGTVNKNYGPHTTVSYSAGPPPRYEEPRIYVNRHEAPAPAPVHQASSFAQHPTIAPKSSEMRHMQTSGHNKMHHSQSYSTRPHVLDEVTQGSRGYYGPSSREHGVPSFRSEERSSTPRREEVIVHAREPARSREHSSDWCCGF